jgi:hypothetical protein
MSEQTPATKSAKKKWFTIIGILAIILIGYFLIPYLPFLQPVTSIEPAQVGVRINRLTGELNEFRQGGVFLVPGVHTLRQFSLRDQIYRPTRSARAEGEAPFQSMSPV